MSIWDLRVSGKFRNILVSPQLHSREKTSLDLVTVGVELPKGTKKIAQQ